MAAEGARLTQQQEKTVTARVKHFPPECAVKGFLNVGFLQKKTQTCLLASQRQIFDFLKTVIININITARMFALVMSQYSIKRYIRGFKLTYAQDQVGLSFGYLI